MLSFFNTISIAKQLPANERIRVPTVRLIDQHDEQKGIMAREKAQKLALEAGLDLVLVSPQSNPPVCRIMDYGKHLYRQNKQDRKQRASQKQVEVKGIRLSLRTGAHDIDVKVKRARKFLSERHCIKVQLIFKGREVTHQDLAREKMHEFAQKLTDTAKIEVAPKRQGNTLFMTLSPLQ